MGGPTPKSYSTLALLTLVLQNTALVILLKMTYRKGASPYAPSSVILITELVKLTCCFAVASYQKTTSSIQKVNFLLCFPSVLYILQNNLLFFGAKLLEPVVYIVCTQTKLLTSAIMARILLGTKISFSQCTALFFLTIGVILVSAEQNSASSGAQEGLLKSTNKGMCAVLLASLSSGLAGTVLEKLYKETRVVEQEKALLQRKTVTHTIWSRNVQLSLISVPFGLLGAYLHKEYGTLTQGFDRYVWGVVFCQAIGGILTAFVMKYASNVLKCMAISISICLCALFPSVTGEVELEIKTVFGIFLVVSSAYVFSSKGSSISSRAALPK